MFKILIFILVIGAIYLVFFKMREKDVKQNTKKNKTKKDEEEDVMVECKKCNTFISTKDAIIKEGEFYCSKECAGMI